MFENTKRKPSEQMKKSTSSDLRNCPKSASSTLQSRIRLGERGRNGLKGSFRPGRGAGLQAGPGLFGQFLRNCPKSRGRSCNVALRDTEMVLVGPYWPSYTAQIYG